MSDIAKIRELAEKHMPKFSYELSPWDYVVQTLEATVASGELVPRERLENCGEVTDGFIVEYQDDHYETLSTEGALVYGIIAAPTETDGSK